MPKPTHMVIERFAPGCTAAVYDRFHRQGRMLPDGLHYVDSWLSADGGTCFQLMATADPALFAPWIARWQDLCEFEVVALGNKPDGMTPPKTR
ncbi:MAG: DUF3303 family protein [Myxococcales bacterium]|nr:DUF3303 family protein [Myxococcales bacterium]